MLLKAKKFNLIVLLLLLAVPPRATNGYRSSCMLTKDANLSHISPVKLDVFNEPRNWLCAMAAFYLAVRVDDYINSSEYSLGYLELDNLTGVVPNCIDPNADQLEMELSLECGNLTISFKRDNHHFFAAGIRGAVELPALVQERQFQVTNRRLFATNDLNHYFSYKGKIELKEEANPNDNLTLTLIFYNAEFEVFRPNVPGAEHYLSPDLNSIPIET